MIKVAYLQCPTGIAGDMCLGSLVDIGVPLEYLTTQLEKLSMANEYRLGVEKVNRQGQLATKVIVDLLKPESVPHRHLNTIENLIQQANLPPKAREWSLKIFRQLAIAEGKVHGVPPERVHFHEVGATDAIVDIVGTCLGLDWLEIEQIYCSPLPVGGGSVKAAHGILPVPVPAVVKLWESRQVPVYANGINQELVTPTGAAIAVTLAEEFGEIPPLQLIKVGLGAGTKDFPIPNILRLWLGNKTNHSNTVEEIAVLETQIDDFNPQGIGYLWERLTEAGALDVFTQAIGMKKSRPGVLLTVICPPELISTCEAVIFRETTTLGVRHRIQPRTILSRHWETLEMEWGTIRLKIAKSEDQIVNVQPEYEDCAAIARQHNLPWLKVYQMALNTWYAQHNETV
ncbi:nickel pincer cofactor biosynthesis protein LarC [Gloeocapsa sp. PCC 73106]|uniref:nickel pincer cofactor biosynthesis protein LarC n=1 Tax=Gloeocapsa sp. PCC 73106 TaxID=102232 RepID=UPI0002AD02D1|nr:nickel pincer cofactor biosynthesis protein LarC [Gloeocapsa sp. PCC 73106]ELR99880.1 TIGR00299 family protein [Gloeocapsa sp. PCC 73106]